MNLAFEVHNEVFVYGDSAEERSLHYIKEAIIDTFGPDLFFERVLQDVQLESISGPYRAALLQALCRPGLHPLMLPYFMKHPCLDVAAAMLERFGTDPDIETRAAVCINSAFVIQSVFLSRYNRSTFDNHWLVSLATVRQDTS